MTLRGWRAERSGSGITAHGTNIDTNEPDKITNIDYIGPPESAADHHVLAHGKDGQLHKLIFA